LSEVPVIPCPSSFAHSCTAFIPLPAWQGLPAPDRAAFAGQRVLDYARAPASTVLLLDDAGERCLSRRLSVRETDAQPARTLAPVPTPIGTPCAAPARRSYVTGGPGEALAHHMRSFGDRHLALHSLAKGAAGGDALLEHLAPPGCEDRAGVQHLAIHRHRCGASVRIPFLALRRPDGGVSCAYSSQVRGDLGHDPDAEAAPEEDAPLASRELCATLMGEAQLTVLVLGCDGGRARERTAQERELRWVCERIAQATWHCPALLVVSQGSVTTELARSMAASLPRPDLLLRVAACAGPAQIWQEVGGLWPAARSLARLGAA